VSDLVGWLVGSMVSQSGSLIFNMCLSQKEEPYLLLKLEAKNYFG
jgi:hypothetical protein